MRARRRQGRLRPLQVAHQEARPERAGPGAGQQGRLPRPLRRRPGRGRLSGRHLVHLRRRRPTSTRSSTRTWSPARSSSASCCRPTSAAEHRRRSVMTPRTARETVDGPAGRIECAVDRPEGAPRGLAVVCHPHPQFGGTLDNKVVQTIARACLRPRLGQRALQLPRHRRFRGRVGRRPRRSRRCARGDRGWRSQPEFAALPLLLAGFSFGGYVAVAAARSARAGGEAAQARARRAVDREAARRPRARRHARDPRRERRRRAALRHARLGAAAESAGDRVPRRRPFLPRAAGLLKNVIARELRDLDAV